MRDIVLVFHIKTAPVATPPPDAYIKEEEKLLSPCAVKGIVFGKNVFKSVSA